MTSHVKQKKEPTY